MASWRQILAAHRNDGSHEDTILAALECGDDVFARWVVLLAELDRLKPLIKAAYAYRKALITNGPDPSIARLAMEKAALALPPREAARGRQRR